MKLSLAPMQGMTNAVYRNAFDTVFKGFDLFYAPFIGTTQKRSISSKLFKDLLPENNLTGHITIPQLLGNNPEDFLHYGQHITELGYDEINWNVGCPYPTVTKKIKGSGLLEYPERMKKFLEHVCNKKDFDLSVKIRLGWADPDEGLEVIKVLNQYPLKEVIIHGRLGIQKYEGVVDLKSFDQLYEASEHDVVYNGDIYTYEDFLRFQSRYPDISSFMIGRGALRNPALAYEIKHGHKMSDMARQIQAFHDYIMTYYQEKLSGEKHVLDKMKEFWSYVGYELDPLNSNLKKIRKASKVSDYKNYVSRLMEEQKIWNR